MEIRQIAPVLDAIARGDTDAVTAAIEALVELDSLVRQDICREVATGDDRSRQVRALGDRLRSLGASRDVVNECYRLSFYLGDDWKTLAKNPMYAFFTANKASVLLDKWIHYFPVYTTHLERFRGAKVRVLEIGTFRGGGHDLFSTYLGPQATVVGIDIDEAARAAVPDRFTVELGDQQDPGFLRKVSEKHGPFDVVIDDGGHRMRQQIRSIETLFPLLQDSGSYIVEDCHTSYWPEYADIDPKGLTFMEWVKQRVDDLNAYHFSADAALETPWQTDLSSLHIYDSIVVFEKRRRFPPFTELSGARELLTHDRGTELVARLTVEGATGEAARLRRLLAESEAELARMQESRSWKLTAPLRSIVSAIKGR